MPLSFRNAPVDVPDKNMKKSSTNDLLIPLPTSTTSNIVHVHYDRSDKMKIVVLHIYGDRSTKHKIFLFSSTKNEVFSLRHFVSLTG